MLTLKYRMDWHQLKISGPVRNLFPEFFDQKSRMNLGNIEVGTTGLSDKVKEGYREREAVEDHV